MWVEGDSMAPTIQAGDLLYISIQTDTNCNGQIVVVIDENQSLLRRVYFKEDGILFTNDNPAYKPEFKPYSECGIYGGIFGKVIGFTRKLK